MKLNLFHRPDEPFEHIDIVYHRMSSHIEGIIAVVEQGVPHLEGRDEDGIVSFPIHKVFYFDTVDRRNYAYLENNIFQVSITLGEVERMFAEYGFCRVNKSQIINLHCIRRVRTTIGMRMVAQMDNGEQLIINRSYRQTFENTLTALGGNAR